jgi:murein DD-endopeptidase MepM/ murein hydrolase activator NlpD
VKSREGKPSASPQKGPKAVKKLREHSVHAAEGNGRFRDESVGGQGFSGLRAEAGTRLAARGGRDGSLTVSEEESYRSRRTQPGYREISRNPEIPMARRHWTLMVVPDDHSGVRQVRLSNRTVRTGVSFGVLLFTVLVSLSAGFFVKEDQRLEAKRLAKANEMLVAELDEIRTDMVTLESSLAQLSRKDEQYRLLANLEPLDEEVKLAGVGGPGSRTVEGSPLWAVDKSLAELTFGTAEDMDALIRRAQVLSTSWDEASHAMDAQVEVWERTPSITPVAGQSWLSSRFSRNRLHPILNVARPHKGIDIVARRGTPVVAAAKGTVVYAGNTGGDYGYMVDVDHGRGVVTRYAHLGKGSVLVKRGQVVERWQRLAEVGSTGLVTSPSLHYEVLVNGRAQNPENFVVSDVLQF